MILMGVGGRRWIQKRKAAGPKCLGFISYVGGIQMYVAPLFRKHRSNVLRGASLTNDPIGV